MQELCGLDVTSTQVSRAVKKLDQELTQWRERPLGEVPYLLVDARYEHVRVSGVVKSCALLLAIGILPDGKRTILGTSSSSRPPGPAPTSNRTAAPGFQRAGGGSAAPALALAAAPPRRRQPAGPPRCAAAPALP